MSGRDIRSGIPQWRRYKVGQAVLQLKVPEIVGKGRPRFTKSGRVHTPRKTEDFEKLIAYEWMGEHGKKYAAHDGPIEVMIYATRELAKSNPKKWEGRADLGKPDIDNISKIVLDALNGVAFSDDCQIDGLVCRKNARVPHGLGNQLYIVINYYQEVYQ